MDWSINNGLFDFFNGKESIDNQDCLTILTNLTDNGIGSYEYEHFIIPAEGIYELSDGQKRILGLPEEYPYSIYIENDGLINQNGFKYITSFTKNHNSGKFRLVEKNYPIIKIESSEKNTYQYILPKDHYLILSEINNLNSQQYKDSSTNYNSFARIKQLALPDNCVYFNEYLQTYDIHSINQIKLNLDNHDGNLEIIPEIPDIQSIKKGEFAKVFDRRNKILPVYTIKGEDDKEHKIVIPEKSEGSLKDLKIKFRNVRDKSLVKDIIDNPQRYLDETLFDLRDFYSERVIEIGLYKPQFYSFISPYKSEWIPGFTIEDRYNGNTNVFLKEENDIQEFSASISQAKQTGDKYIDFKGYKLELSQAENMLDIAVRQNKNPQKPLQEKDGKKVLIIEENAETLGYKVKEMILDIPEKYHLYRIEGLKPTITLKDHQAEGIAWLQHLITTNCKGCLLADDMGLGKTLQILCLIDWHNRYRNTENKPYLIVSPVTLLNNWEKEIAKFLLPGSLTHTILHGGMISKQRNDLEIEWLKKQKIILTNYETVRSCQFNICAVDFAIVVLDEAQRIKTPGTYVTCAAKALKSGFKIAMTGTPVENTFLDLWCIMDFAIPGLLSNAKAFAAKYQRPLKNAETNIEKLGKELRQAMGAFFMRRKKIDVLKDLPEKSDVKCESVMTPIQEQKYISLIAQSQTELSNGNHSAILTLLNKLRKISDSLLLLDNIDPELVGIQDLIQSSAKIQSTIDILNTIKSKEEKAIIFCIYKESQRILQRIIQSTFQITPKIINGDTKVLNTIGTRHSSYSRQQAIDDFESRIGFNVIIMSPIAAGMGLNVTAANHVIHFGRHWNPAKEAQATDRAYRIGQNRPVYVYYPITTLSHKRNFKSFDQTLDELLMKKTTLANATLFPTEATEVTIDDFKEFLSQKL